MSDKPVKTDTTLRRAAGSADFRIDMFSLVDRCPYCGAAFDEEGKMHDGKPCPHPTKMTSARGFMAASGTKRKP